jgi:hypothetical protein
VPISLPITLHTIAHQPLLLAKEQRGYAYTAAERHVGVS